MRGDLMLDIKKMFVFAFVTGSALLLAASHMAETIAAELKK
jgi:hypothetical protein